MVRIEIPESLKKIHFSFPEAPHAGRLVLRMNNICKTYDGKRNVIDNLDLTVENGDCLVVSGKNGAGKSTLLRIIAGVDKDFSGEIIPGAGVKVGYFSQDNAETIKGKETILEYLESQAPLPLIPKIRDMLGAFLFRGDDVYKSLDVLSGGEKSRIALLQLLLSPVNLLVLDEPTNHLDIHSKDVLISALKDFGGTVIFVSHDRGFIDGLATSVLALEPGKFSKYPGGYEYFLEQTEGKENSNNGDILAMEGKSSETVQETVSETKLNWEEQKKRDAERRKLEKEVSKLEDKISELEEKKSELETKMADPSVYSNGEKAKAVQRDIDDVEKELEEVNAMWEEKAMELEG